jgi:hypothetical protein
MDLWEKPRERLTAGAHSAAQASSLEVRGIGRTDSDATPLLLSTAARAATIGPAMQSTPTDMLARTHLTVVGGTGACPRELVDEAIPAGGLQSHFGFVSSSSGDVGGHDLRLQGLVELLDVLL